MNTFMQASRYLSLKKYFNVPPSPLVWAVGLLSCSFPVLLTGCQDGKKASEAALFQRLDSTQTQVGFVNQLKDSSDFNILDYLYFYNGAGVAAGDVNNDGW